MKDTLIVKGGYARVFHTKGIINNNLIAANIVNYGDVTVTVESKVNT